MQSGTNSRFPGFYKLGLPERQAVLEGRLDAEEVAALTGVASLPIETADRMVENAIGTFGLPLGLALNFRINGRDVIIPMAVEEPSVIAGASNAARLARAGGGFTASADRSVMTGQMQVLDIPADGLAAAREAVLAAKADLLAGLTGLHPTIVRLGGGALDLEARILPDTPIGPFLVVELLYDVRDAMGANAVNTACEQLAPEIERLTGGRVHLRILTNLTDRRKARSACKVQRATLAFDEFEGEAVAQGIVEAWAFAAADPHRAATHNKGIMNGIDPVLIATGNDWRAVEAGAHAYAARSGRYTSLSTWKMEENGDLSGELELPLAVGIVGGVTKAHPGAQAALKLMGVESAAELAEIAVSVGLAQNLAALRALATEGIQRGHMRLHGRK
ncbi:MAG TPA: hydroxymethylglutaryl-CoA reductase, degradative [Anaerolineales bacterium]|nr:hydroxymethylglutaryl-CoA reductase, degradative [Anaerolineales bacterium]